MELRIMRLPVYTVMMKEKEVMWTCTYIYKFHSENYLIMYQTTDVELTTRYNVLSKYLCFMLRSNVIRHLVECSRRTDKQKVEYVVYSTHCSLQFKIALIVNWPVLWHLFAAHRWNQFQNLNYQEGKVENKQHY